MSWKNVKDKMLSGKEDVINGNALIAKFEGYSIDDSGDFFNGIHYYKLDGLLMDLFIIITVLQSGDMIILGIY